MDYHCLITDGKEIWRKSGTAKENSGENEGKKNLTVQGGQGYFIYPLIRLTRCHGLASLLWVSAGSPCSISMKRVVSETKVITTPPLSKDRRKSPRVIMSNQVAPVSHTASTTLDCCVPILYTFKGVSILETSLPRRYWKTLSGM